MATIDAMPYLPFTEPAALLDGVFRWRLGVRPLAPADWFEFGPDATGPSGWIAEKRQLNAERHDDVFAVLDGIEPESSEVADAIAEHLAAHHPQQHAELDRTVHPLDAAARLVPDDLVVMVERDGQLVFGGGSVCFPNRWDLRSKLGLTMAEVHEPVADLNAQLRGHVDRFLQRLSPGKSFWRLGWGVIDVADGFTPPVATPRPEQAALDPATMFVRVERETLRRFPKTGCVLFTIRTYVSPVTMIDRPLDRSALAAALDAMPTGIRDYKGLADVSDRLIRWLRTDPH